MAGALREKLNTLPLTLLNYKPDTLSFLQKQFALERKADRFGEVRYVVKDYPTLSVTANAIWYEEKNTAWQLEPNGKPSVNTEESRLFIGRYVDKLHRRYFDSAKLYSVQLKRKPFIQEQTEGPIGERTVKVLSLYDEWVRNEGEVRS